MRTYNVLGDVFNQQKGIAATALNGAAPQVATGNDIGPAAVPDVLLAEVGTLSARIAYRITTNLLQLTATWEVSLDGTNWFKLVDHNNTAQASFATGTGSLVTGTVFVSAPMAAYGYTHVRCKVTTSAAAGAGGTADQITALDYSWIRSDHLGE